LLVWGLVVWIPGTQTTNPKQQLTISLADNSKKKTRYNKSRLQKSQESRATEFQLGDGNVEEQNPSQD